MKKFFCISVLCGLIVGSVSGCVLNPKKQTSHQRQELFNKTQLKTEKPVEVLWNSYSVPRVEAQTDADLFYTVGALQMHLRRAQLEFMRKIAFGRVSELVGGSTKDLDHFLRAMNFPKLAQKNWDTLSQESKLALEQMARGMNDYQEQNPKRPVDLRLAGIKDEKWSALDLATIHKFISIDINWMMYARIMGFVEKPYYQRLWQTWLGGEKSLIEALMQEKLLPPETAKLQPIKNEKHLEVLSQYFTKAGSNAFAVGASKTQTGSALLSSDPHLGIMIPNLWMFMVLSSPSYQSMGLMMPSFPLPAVGRNQNIAWGGTNMWSISTHLIEVSEEELSRLDVREEKIRVRFGRDKKIKIQEIDGRPIVSDIPMFKSSKPLSLYWVGAESSDEVLAFLKLNRAKNWQDFKEAFVTYAASGQNFVYADEKGQVGKVAAFRQLQLDQNYQVPLPKFVAQKTFKNVNALPIEFRPPTDVVVSANEALPVMKNNKSESTNDKNALFTPISVFHAPNDRVDRMRELLLNYKKPVDLKYAQQIQLDVHSASALKLSRIIVDVIESELSNEDLSEVGSLDRASGKAKSKDKGSADSKAHLYQDHLAYQVLKNWDGNYDLESEGALVFEVLSARLMESYWSFISSQLLESDAEVLKSLYSMHTRSTAWRKDLGKVLQNTPAFVEQQNWTTHLNIALVRLKEFKNWGAFHPITVAHPLGRAPLVGKSFRFYQGPYMGGNETLMKSAHNLSSAKAPVNFGAQSRWLTDLSSVDANYFVMLGGQDGWLKSDNTNDQTPLWLKGAYLHIPFSKEAFMKSSAVAEPVAPSH